MVNKRPATRRQLLTTIGGILGGAGVVGLSGTATAQLRAGTAWGGADVHDFCGGNKIGHISGDERGDVLDSCDGPDGRTWYYVDWDDASPDGWAREGLDVAVYA